MSWWGTTWVTAYFNRMFTIKHLEGLAMPIKLSGAHVPLGPTVDTPLQISFTVVASKFALPIVSTLLGCA